MFYDDRVDNLKKSRDYSVLNQSKASRAEDEDGDWQDGDGGSHGRGFRSSQDKEAGKEWGGFFGSKPNKSAAERLAELRARAEQERVRREMEKMRADRIAASKKTSVSGSASGASQKPGASHSSESRKSDVMQKVRDLEKHSRAQMLKQARDFSDLLGSGGPASQGKSHTPEAQKTGAVPRKPEQQRASTIGGETISKTLREVKQKLGEKRLESRVPPKPTPRKQPVRPVATARHSSESKSRRPEADQRLPRKEAPSKGGLAISSLATVTPEGALVANRGLSLEEAKRLKKGAKLLGMKLYFESDDKERLKEEKTRQEQRAAGRGATESGKAVEARVLGGKTGGSKSGVPPRSLDEERRRDVGVPSRNGSIVTGKPGTGKAQSNGGNPRGVGLKQARLDMKAPHTLQKSAPSSFGRDRASGGPPRGNGFLPYQERPGQLKRKHPEEEESDSFLDEGEEEDEEEGPSREAVSSLIRKMFRYDPHKYVADDRDDPRMEVGFKHMQAEELRSARIAREEDEREAERLELEERRREEKRRKKAASNKFIDD